MYELKAVQNNQTINTTNGHLKNASHKKNARLICFDNSDGGIDDGELIKFIKRSQAFKRGRVYIIDSDGNYRFIR